MSLLLDAWYCAYKEADEHAETAQAELLAIMAMPWKTLRRSLGNGEVEEFRLCPGCRRDVDKTPHAPECCWHHIAKWCGIA